MPRQTRNNFAGVVFATIVAVAFFLSLWVGYFVISKISPFTGTANFVITLILGLSIYDTFKPLFKEKV
ncbi:hypothetical protein HYV85_04670 [Candidatus Woesearchaeota archaeon]|nr:hypothetical protein [Candidatus Woesearchaeota archaeon]